jgi:hypothetical protein
MSLIRDFRVGQQVRILTEPKGRGVVINSPDEEGNVEVLWERVAGNRSRRFVRQAAFKGMKPASELEPRTYPEGRFSQHGYNSDGTMAKNVRAITEDGGLCLEVDATGWTGTSVRNPLGHSGDNTLVQRVARFLDRTFG